MGDMEAEVDGPPPPPHAASPSSSTLESLPGLFQRNEEDFAHEYYFSELSHALNVLQGLNKQRLDVILCDVTICVQGCEFPCHRNVLAACSPYFLAMFTGDMQEKSQAQVEICGIDPDIMKQLIDYAYTSDITINQENAQHLLSAANMVQINSIREACCRFLEREMDPSNCLGIHCFAEAHVCEALARTAKSYALENFAEVAQHDEILLLPTSKLIEFIELDELNVENEEVVLQAVLDWIKHEPEKRKGRFAEVLKFVRLPLVSPYFLFDKVDGEPFLSETPECRVLVQEAMKYHILKDRLGELSSCRTTPRHSQPTHSIIITTGGEIYNKNYLNNVDCFDFDDGRWGRLKELPFARCHHGTVVSEGKNIYVAGGFNKEKHVLNNVLRYEPTLDRWIKVANMNTPRARHAMATLDGYVYVIGGYDGLNRIDSVERYNPATNQWSAVAPISVALSRCNAASLNGFLYVAGGSTEPNNQCVDLVQRYNPHTNSWQILAPMPIPRCLGALIPLNGYLYAVGGTEQMVTASRTLSRYNPQTNRWTELAQMIEPRFDAARKKYNLALVQPGLKTTLPSGTPTDTEDSVALLNNKIYVLSGHDGENSFYHSIEVYDSDNDTWNTMTSTTLPYGRCRFGCVAISMPLVT